MGRLILMKINICPAHILLPPFFLRSSSSSSINKHWEAELEALKGNNAKLTAALLESTANVKQWKQQLAAYQDEAERLHKRVITGHIETQTYKVSDF